MVSKFDFQTLNKPPSANGGLGWTLDGLLDVREPCCLTTGRRDVVGGPWRAGGRPLPLNLTGGPKASSPIHACQPRIPSIARPRDPNPKGDGKAGTAHVKRFTDPNTGSSGDV